MINLHQTIQTSLIAAGAKPHLIDKGPSIGKLLALTATAALFTGCASTMSGLGESSSSFACKAPEGVTCKSVTGIYSNAAQHSLPAQMSKSKDTAAVKVEEKPVKLNSYYDDKARGQQLALLNPSKANELSKMPPSLMTTPQSGDPIRSLPLTLRIWLAPWIDADGDLHDQHYVYSTVHNGEWLIEANQAAIKDKYKAVSISKRAIGLGKTPATANESSIGEALGSTNTNTDGATK